MDVDDLRSLYLSELQEVCGCEAQITEELARAAMSAGSSELRTVISQHSKQSVLHGQRIETIFLWISNDDRSVLPFDLVQCPKTYAVAMQERSTPAYSASINRLRSVLYGQSWTPWSHSSTGISFQRNDRVRSRAIKVDRAAFRP